VCERLVDRKVFAEGTVDRWRGGESHPRAEVVPAGQALLAGQTRHSRLDGHPLPDGKPRDFGADSYDLAGRLVPQHEWLTDHVLANPAVLVVVHIGAAHAYGLDPDEHFARTGLRDWPLLQYQVVRGPQHRRLHHGHRRLLACVTVLLDGTEGEPTNQPLLSHPAGDDHWQ
jgi:hypothetical protein